MENKFGYLVLEIGWEYDDSFHSTGNNGETYEAPKEIFLDKEDAEAYLIKKEIEAFRGRELGSYIGEEGIEEILLSDMKTLSEYVLENFKMDLGADDFYNFKIPKKASDEAVIGLLKLITLRFYQLIKIPIK